MKLFTVKLAELYPRGVFVKFLISFVFAWSSVSLWAQCPPEITVNPLTGGVNISGTHISFCAGDTIRLTSTPAASYQWYLNGLPWPDSVNQSVTIWSSGNYSVMTDGCTEMSVVWSVTVHAAPSAAITVSPSPPVCSGTPVTLTLVTNGDQKTWLTPVLTTQNPLVYTPTANFTAKAVAINGPTGCSRVVTQYVQVYPLVNAGQVGPSQTICPGDTPSEIVQAVAPTGGSGTYSFYWMESSVSATGPWTIIPGAQSANFQPGVHTQSKWYRRSAESPPCAVGVSNVVEVKVNPNPTVSSSLTAAICSGNAVNYTPTSAAPGTSFAWSSSVISGGVTGNGSGSGQITDVLSLPVGQAVSGVVEYTLTPTGTAPSFCPGVASVVAVSVDPIPSVTNTETSQVVCSGQPTDQVDFTSDVAGTTFSWTATTSSGIIQFPTSGSGALQSFVPINTTLSEGTITITVVPSGPVPTSCSGSAFTYTITVRPAPTVTNPVMEQTVCSGEDSDPVVFQTNVTGTSFTWTATPSSGAITGFTASGTGNIPAQTLHNSGTVQGQVIYHIVPDASGGGCPGAARDYTIFVNPLPVMTSQVTAATCSGSLFSYTITTGVAGSSFAWSRGATAGISNAPSSGNTASISESLINTTSASVTVVYQISITGPGPDFCPGPHQELHVTVRPLPLVNAGTDLTIAYGTATTLSGSATVETGPATPGWTPTAFIASGAGSFAPVTTNLYNQQEFTLLVTDGAGCENTDKMWVFLSGTPLEAQASAALLQICAGQSVQLTGSATGGSGTYNYSWSPSTGLSDPTSPNPLATPAVTTTYTLTVNDGFNSDQAQVTITVIPNPVPFAVSGGGEICYGSTGVQVTLAGSENTSQYHLELNGSPVSGAGQYGTGAPLVWNNLTDGGTYTVLAITNVNNCATPMSGSALLQVNPLPTAFTVTGGGSYQLGGSGLPVGLSSSQPGIVYELELIGTGVVAPSPLVGNGSPLSFGLQTAEGIYQVTATDYSLPTHCSNLMSGVAVILVNPNPTVMSVTGGGVFCEGNPGVAVGLDSTETGINYSLRRNGVATGIAMPGTGSAISFGEMTEGGTYTVLAQNVATGASIMMNGVAVVTVLSSPVAYTLIPSGDQCPGTELFLNGSESGVLYILRRDGNPVDTLTGVGGMGLLGFGPLHQPGIYDVVGAHPTACSRPMTGTLNITTPPAMFGVIPAGVLCPENEVLLSGSEVGINYQLRRDGTVNAGMPVAGTGSLLNFGSQLLPGIYTVVAINPVTLCEVTMADSASLYAAPGVYSLNPQGDTCGPVELTLGGSQLGYTYHLYRDLAVPSVLSIAGTGAPVSFGVQVLTGTYTVKAVCDTTLCVSPMSGSVTLHAAPQLFNVAPSGLVCPGQVVGLDGSEPGVFYQLILNGSVLVGGEVPGTGAALNFGTQSLPGVYTVEARYPGLGCSALMNSSATLTELPSAFGITPQGVHCAGVEAGLSGSETGVTYYLIRNAMVSTPVSVVAGTGLPLSFGSLPLAGTYTVAAFDDATGCEVSMNGQLVLNPNPVVYNLVPAGLVCEPAAVSLSGTQPGVSYSLYNNGVLVATLTGTGSGAGFGLQPAGVYTSAAINSNSCEAAMNGTVTITGQPVVSLPSTAEVCAGNPVELSPVVTLGTSPQWTTSGDGFFDDPTALNTFYFPGTADTASGNVTLTLHVSGLSACAATTATASVAVTIAPNPGVDAGTDQLLCVTGQALLSATAWHCSSTLWSTTGDGSFVDAGSTATTYLPGPADLATGSAMLVVTGTGNGVCQMLTDADTLLLTFSPLPTAEAGAAQTLCAGSNALLSGTATNGNTVAWSTSGSGYFTPPSSLNTVYHPSEADKSAGTVWLKLTVAGAAPCLLALASDSLMLTIQPAPVVLAGPDVVACITQMAVPVLATATHATAPLWTTTGDGTFANPHATATQYLPGGGDLAAGLVTLVFSASGTATCSLLTVSDSVVVSFSPLPSVDAGADASTCANGSYMLSGGATGVASVQWSSTGDGIFDNAALLNATYFPGPSDSLTGSVILTLTGFGAGSCSLQMATDDMLLSFAPVPVVNAGTDFASCHTTQVQLDGEAFDYQSVMWSSGGGGIFSNASALNPLFTPSLASVQTGSVKLYLRAFGTGLCSGVVATDSVEVALDPLPAAFAGPDITGCGHSPDTVTLATAQHYSTLQWSTTGDGLLLHSTTLSPVYIPGNNDIATGQAELTLTVAGVATCVLQTASDEALVLLYPQPVASAGADISVCSGSAAQLNGTAQYFTAVEWSSTGDGTFTAINTLSPVYQPGAADLVAGHVQLIVGAQGQSQCLNAWDYDTLLLTLNPLPVADAGDPLLTCINNPIELNGITQNSSSVLWTTAGDGQFADATMPQTLYTPGSADVAAGQVLLTLTAWGDLMCSSQSAADQTLLTMTPLPTVDAGADGAVCTGDFFQCQASAAYVQGVVWSTTGDGTFSNNQVLNPLYQPGMLDRATGHVALIVTATGEMPCGAYHDSDTLTLSISPLPTGFITGTSTICQGQTAQVQVLLTGTAPWSITWSNSVSSTTVNNIMASPYQFEVAPTATSGYYLTAVSDARCSATQISGMAVVTVNPQPQPFALFAVGNGEFCEGSDGAEIRLSGSQTGVVYQLWFGSVTMGFPVVGTGLPLSFGMHSLPGNYTATATSFGTGCVETMTGVVTLSAIPSPEVAFTADTVCLGTATQFTLQVANPLDVVSYTWNFGDGQSVTYTSPENPSHEYAIPGEFNVELTAVNTVGCTTSFMFPVRVMPAADPWFWWNGTACAASVVEFENFSVVASPAYITGWHWNFGDGHDTTILWPQNPNVGHVYADAGQYAVTLTVTTSNGCQSAETRQLTIKPRPVANFASSGSCQDMAVLFTDLTQQAGAGNIEQWNWSFGDPASGTANFSVLQNPGHVYAAPGSFEVVLEVFTNNGCSDTALRMVDVLPAPLAAFTADTVCVGQATQFSDQSVASTGAIVQWLWNFGDGSLPVGDQNPLHTFAFGGSYIVTLTVTTSDGCQNTTMQPVEVLALPSAVFTTSSANCVSNPVTFDDQSVTTSGYINQWHWDFGDGTQTTVVLPGSPDVEHLYPGAGQFLATLTVTTAAGCEAQAAHLVQVNGAPMANFTAPDNNCQAVPVPFTDQSQAAGNGALVSWEWNFGEPASGTANTSVLQNPMHQYLTEGTYDVLLVVHNNSGCADSIVKQVVVVPAPVASFTADTVCLGSATTFTDQSTGGALPITSWLWDFGDGTTSVLQNPVHTYAAAGSYVVALQIATPGGCTHDTAMMVIVNQVPAANFSSSGSCSGTAVQFTDLSQGNGSAIQSWLWDFGDGDTSSLQNPQHIFPTGGTFVVSLTVSTQNGCQHTTTQPLLIYASPSADFGTISHFCPEATVEFINQSTGNGTNVVSHVWSFGYGMVSTLVNPVFTFPEPDTCYDVTLVVTNVFGCSDTTTKPACTRPPMEFAIEYTGGCFGQPFTFHAVNLASGDSLVNVNWHFGDPASGIHNFSLLHNPTHLFTAPGQYVVWLKVWNSDYCTDSTFQIVTVESIPAASFAWTEGPHCDTTVTFAVDWNNVMNNVQSASWDFGDGTVINLSKPIPAEVTHVFASYGLWPVTLSYSTAAGCLADTTLMVEVKCVEAAFAVADSVLCEGDQVVFNDLTSAPGVVSQWQWDFGDGSTLSYSTPQPSVTHTFGASGTFEVQLKVVVNVGGTPVADSVVHTLVVHPKPRAGFVADGHCAGAPVIFTDTTRLTTGTVDTVLWNLGNLTSSAGSPVSYTFEVANRYNITLRVVSDRGCADTVVQTLTVDPHPVVMLTPTTGELCNPQEGVMLSEASGSVAETWEWRVNQQEWMPADSASWLWMPDAGENQVWLRLTDSAGCQWTDSAQYLVHTNPVAGFTFSPDSVGHLAGEVEFRDASVPGDGAIVEWRWHFGDTSQRYRQDVNFNFTTPGWQPVTLYITDQHGCTDEVTDSVKVFKTHSFLMPTAFTPGYDNINATFKPFGVSLQGGTYTMVVYDRWGRLVFESKSPDEGWDGMLNGELMPSGAYVWMVQMNLPNTRPQVEQGTVMLVR